MLKNPVINIFGVGRSGTKSIQAYLAYLLFSKFEAVKLNYEPYYWSTRNLTLKNSKGIWLLFNENCSDTLKPISAIHENFIKSLNDINHPTITKYIRGNGFIKSISKFSNSNKNLVVIRNLTDVLKSVEMQKFNFYSVGYKWEKSYWNKIVNEMQQCGLFLNNEINMILSARSDLEKNAAYWFIMNIWALNSYSESTYFLHYEDLKSIENRLMNFLGLVEFKTKYRFSDLNGNCLHDNSIFLDIEKTRINPIKRYFINYSHNFRPNYLFHDHHVGNLIALNNNERLLKSRRIKINEQTTFHESYAFDYYQDRVFEVFLNLDKRLVI